VRKSYVEWYTFGIERASLRIAALGQGNVMQNAMEQWKPDLDFVDMRADSLNISRQLL
jgi:hypothetical protein